MVVVVVVATHAVKMLKMLSDSLPAGGTRPGSAQKQLLVTLSSSITPIMVLPNSLPQCAAHADRSVRSARST